MTNVLDHCAPTHCATAPRRRRLGAASAATLALLTGAGLLLDQSATAQAAASAIDLGTADSFAVLAGSGITNTGPTSILGDIGSYPTPTIVGNPSGGPTHITLTGTEQRDATLMAAAKADLETAHNNARDQASNLTISDDLGGKTLTAGVYSSPTASSLGLTGALTLDAQGNADAIFVLQADSTLTTDSNSRVLLTNGAQACNVFWQVGSSATLGSGTDFVGNILAHTSITLVTGASVTGRALAMNGAVTMDNNVINRPACATTGGGGSSGDTGGDSGTDGSEAAGGSDAAAADAAGGSRSSGGSGSEGTGQVRRIPVGSVDAGDGSSVLGRTPHS